MHPRGAARGARLRGQVAGGDRSRARHQAGLSRRSVAEPECSKVVVEAFLSKADLPGDRLTVREREVLKLIGEEKTTKELAALLNISVKTAESHRRA